MDQTDIKNMSLQDFLMSIRDGGLVEEIATDLRMVVAGVEATGNPGSLTIKLDVAKNGDKTVSIKDTITRKEPIPTKGQEIFFIVPGGGLSRQNPAQLQLGSLKDVN